MFLLWHGDDLNDGGPDGKLLGVYSTEDDAKARIQRAKGLPGFREYPDAFQISRYIVNKDEWTEGYVEV